MELFYVSFLRHRLVLSYTVCLDIFLFYCHEHGVFFSVVTPKAIRQMTFSVNQQIGFLLSIPSSHPFYLYLLLRVGRDRQQSSIMKKEHIAFAVSNVIS